MDEALLKRMRHVEDQSSVRTRWAKHDASAGPARRRAALLQRQQQVVSPVGKMNSHYLEYLKPAHPVNAFHWF